MSDSYKKRLGELSVERVRALSDGIFAFAMTVLVLDLHLPDAIYRTNAEFLSILAAHWHHLLSFLLSFVVLAMYWIAHHNTFILVNRTTRILVVANLVFLMCIVLIPFAASFLGQDSLIQAAVVTYGIVLSLTSSALALLVTYVFRNEGLVEQENVPAGLFKAALQRILFPIFVYFLSVVTSFESIQASVAIYVILPIVFLLPSRVDHWSK